MSDPKNPQPFKRKFYGSYGGSKIAKTEIYSQRPILWGIDKSLVNATKNVTNSQPQLRPLAQTEPNLTRPPSPISELANPLRRPVSELPARFRPVFEPYISFNHVQSLVFNSVMQTTKPIVVSAPTGSGKTGIFELAIIKMIMYVERNVDLGAAKVIYLAPTKALCTERRIDWEKKFSQYNIQCIELTSDISHTVNFKLLNKSSILLATPEKWDSITRSWSGNRSFVQSIRLLLVDEVHLINDGHRGATLEAVISRMKIIRSLMWPTEPDNLRFIAVSATVSNINDISEWFSSDITKAEIFEVHAKERPVKLKTVVIGYDTNKITNEFQFDYGLNNKLPDIIKRYSNQKPTLIFCTTRKSTVNAATSLIKSGDIELCFSVEKRNTYLAISSQMKDKTLQETTRFGIAFHHAGLTAADRNLVETGFLNGRIMILCCTSTLAIGVNLPAHLVIIKNTSYYDEGTFKPYSESSLVQMIGRAGRPQFDTEATAVIMTKTSNRSMIEKMLTGKLVIDSHLHKFLTEHLNSEIVLGTITDDDIARKWVDSTFLHVRLMKNPINYGLKANSKGEIENAVKNWCRTAIEKLLKYKLVTRINQQQLESTEAGKAMARHYISLETMIKFVNIQGKESIWDLIKLISTSQEVLSEIQIRIEDKSSLSSLINPEDERMKLRYQLEKIDCREKKAAALIQATFGNVSLRENTILQESIRVMKSSTRVVNCLKDVVLVNNEIGYMLLKNAMLLAQCFASRLWFDSIYITRQIEKIGPILSYNLAHNGMTSFESLRKANPRNIEIFCNRLPPFGTKVQQTCFGLPVYDLKLYFRSIPNQHSQVQIMIEVRLANGQDLRQNLTLPDHEAILIIGNLEQNKLLLKQRVQDNVILRCPDLTMCYGTEVDKLNLPKNGAIIEAILMSESFVGLNCSIEVKYTEPEPIVG